MSRLSCRDLLEEIYSRLPADSLIRFKQVCKSWHDHINSLLDNPSFVAKHLQNSKHCATPTLLAFTVDAMFDKNDFDTADHVDVEEFCIMPLPETQNQDYMCHVYHCNGLILLINCQLDVTLFNPTLMEFKILKGTKLDQGDQNHINVVAIGFGYNSIDNDYKIVGIWSDESTEIFSVRSQTWKKSKKSIDLDVFIYSGILSPQLHHQGVFYWLDDGETTLLAFDLHTEVYNPIQCPGAGSRNSLGSEITVLENSIAFMLSVGDRWSGNFEVWLMNEPVKGDVSWTKHLRIGPIENFMDTIMFWKSDEMLIRTSRGSSLALYNLSTAELRRVSVKGNKDIFWCGLYVKTLVSVGRLTEV